MKKKNIIILIILLPLFIFTIYKLIILFKFNNLEKYKFIDNEIVIKEVKYNNKNYIISRYYNNSSSWSNLNILLNSNNAYYILKNMKKDISYMSLILIHLFLAHSHTIFLLLSFLYFVVYLYNLSLANLFLI